MDNYILRSPFYPSKSLLLSRGVKIKSAYAYTGIGAAVVQPGFFIIHMTDALKQVTTFVTQV